MYPIEEFERTLRRLSSVLDGVGISFALTGGFASMTHGEPRFTQDADVVIDPDAARRNVAALIADLEAADYFLNPQTVEEAVRTGRQFQLLDNADVLKIDMYPREMVGGEVGRAVRREVFDGVELPVIALPDAVASKLVWIRKGSHKSRRDVRLMMAAAVNEDRLTARRTAADLGLETLLDEVLSEPDEIEPPA